MPGPAGAGDTRAMSPAHDRDRVTAPIAAPVRLTVECAGCGYSRTTLALHDGAVARARTCPRCGTATDVLDVQHVPGGGCCCCT